MRQSVAVIGAGVVGLSCASYLQLRGHAVTVIDPRPPGEYCSFGNAGCFSRASCVPLGLPGIWKKVPGWLMDPLGPLTIRWSYLPKALPWFLAAGRNAMPDRVAKHLGGGPGTPAFDNWAGHPALRILYVNTFKRVDG